jgi:hypothetical protein
MKAPMQGPWYWVYLNPKWKLFAFPAVDQESSLGHSEAWLKVADAIAAHYRIRDSRLLAELRELPYCMPRGRVCRLPDGRWVAWHGHDRPVAWSGKQIVKAFGLRGRPVSFEFDEHEKTLREERRAIDGIIGPVPYNRR